jgi:hypothetical protein
MNGTDHLEIGQEILEKEPKRKGDISRVLKLQLNVNIRIWKFFSKFEERDEAEGPTASFSK